MHSLAAHGISADMVVGSSVGALNGAFYAGDPTLEGVLQAGKHLARTEAPGRFSDQLADPAGLSSGAGIF